MQLTAHLYQAKQRCYVFNIDDLPAEVTVQYITGLQKYFQEAYPNHKTYLRITNNV
jgi:hypothetical protein